MAAQRSLWQCALIRRLNQAWTGRGLLAWLLWPISVLFAALVALRRALYRANIFKTQGVAVPVIVVGNVVAGGSGKTPLVMALVQHLQANAWRVGVIARGHGRQTRDCREVMVDSSAADVGDEPALIKRSTAAPVFVALRRIDAARTLLAHYPDTQVIISDDGLQHLGLRRDLEICVFDDRGVGNGFLLPAGPLREPWPRAVDLVLHSGAHPAFAGHGAQRTLAACAVGADGSQIALTELAHPDNKPLLALAAIARPEEFFAMLRAQGLHLAKSIALPDHWNFDDWSDRDYDSYTVICTEKDAVKLWQKHINALAVPLRLTPESAFLVKLDALLSTRQERALSSRHGHTTT